MYISYTFYCWCQLEWGQCFCHYTLGALHIAIYKKLTLSTPMTRWATFNSSLFPFLFPNARSINTEGRQEKYGKAHYKILLH